MRCCSARRRVESLPEAVLFSRWPFWQRFAPLAGAFRFQYEK
jgi:hypothetical protein